eukprot:1402913-Rhodomonas_salina.1
MERSAGWGHWPARAAAVAWERRTPFRGACCSRRLTISQSRPNKRYRGICTPTTVACALQTPQRPRHSQSAHGQLHALLTHAG